MITYDGNINISKATVGVTANANVDKRGGGRRLRDIEMYEAKKKYAKNIF